MDDDKSFYIINGRYCLACRNHEWAKRYPYYQHISLVKKDMQIQYNAIIILQSNSPVDFKTTLKSFVKQTLPPKLISIIRPITNTLVPSQLITNYLQDIKIPWTMRNSTHTSIKNSDALNFLIDNNKYQYHTIFNSGYNIGPRVFEKINYAITEDLLQFHYVKGIDDNNGIIIPHFIFKYLGGNHRNSNILDKITNYSSSPKILDIKDLCPTFPK